MAAAEPSQTDNGEIDLDAIIKDPTSLDTDGDQILDLDEILLTGTDPTAADTDQDGTDDGFEDPDEDGLINFEELTLGTDPLLSDTDGDLLDDKAEVDGGTDPLKQDTDDDGSTDESELSVGTDPLDPDSDGNGIADGQETFTTIASSTDGQVIVELTGMSDIAKHTQIRSPAGDVRFQDLAGQVGSAVYVSVEQPFVNMRIRLPYNISEVTGGDMDGLGILRYDEERRGYERMGQNGRDANHIWIDSPYDGTFVLIHMPTWEAHWAANQKKMQDALNEAIATEEARGEEPSNSD